MQEKWREPDFVGRSHAWIDERLADLGRRRTGAIEQPHVTDWSTVMRVPTDDGTVWFKANDDTMRHEAAVLDLVAARSSGRVPAPLVHDAASGWMLLADGGQRLRELVEQEHSLARWLDVLEAYARVQIACEDVVDELLARGLPDRRLVTLPGAYADLVTRLPDADRRLPPASDIEELCARLAAYGIRETVQHDDLHDGQVFLGNGVHQVLDWGDACVSHPFFTLAVTLEGVISWGTDDVADSEDLRPHLAAYLQPYAVHYGTTVTHLREAAAIAMRLGWVCRAVNGWLPQDPERTHVRLKMFLDGKP